MRCIHVRRVDSRETINTWMGDILQIEVQAFACLSTPLYHVLGLHFYIILRHTHTHTHTNKWVALLKTTESSNGQFYTFDLIISLYFGRL